MTTGDDKPKKTRKTTSRRRRAVRPPTIDLEATEVAESAPGADAAPTSETPVRNSADAGPAGEGTARGSATEESSGSKSSGTVPSVSSSLEGVSLADINGDEESNGTPAVDLNAESDEGVTDAAPDTETTDDETSPSTGESDEASTETGDGAGPATPLLATARRASLIGAGLVGALIALVIYLGLYYGGVLPRDRGTMIGTLLTQAQDIRRRTSVLEASAARGAKRNIPKKVGELQARLKELGSDPKNSLVRRVKNLETRITKLAAATKTAPISAALETRLAAIEKQAASLASRPVPVAPEPTTTEPKTANGETPDNRAAISGSSVGGSALTALTSRITALDTKLQAMAKTVADLAKSGGTEMTGKLSKLSTEMTAINTEVADLSGKLAKSTKTLNSKLAGFEKTIAASDTGDATRATAGVLALTALEKTVNSGQPYTAELTTLGTTLGGKADLSVLEASAARGVAGLDTLKSQFAGLSDSIATAGLSAGGSTEEGLIGTLLASAKSLVQVRQTGQVEGDGSGAIVSRIEASLATGDLTAAQTEWATLDPAAQAVSKSWADALKARIAVDKALAGLSASLTASLSAATAPKN